MAKRLTPSSTRDRRTAPPRSHALLQRVRRALVRTETADRLGDTFKVLGDATRVRIIDALSHESLCVSDITALLGLSESAISHQLRLLRGCRLVRGRRAGRLVVYSLDDQHILGLFRQARQHVEEDHPHGGA